MGPRVRGDDRRVCIARLTLRRAGAKRRAFKGDSPGGAAYERRGRQSLAENRWSLCNSLSEALSIVMAGLVPAIHVFCPLLLEGVDARHKAGHDVLMRKR